jgi:hypothetical protein
MNRKNHAKERGEGEARETSILQNNMQMSRIVPHEIRTQLKADGTEVLLMQESYSIEGKISGLGTGVAIVCRGSKHDPPRTAVGVRSKMMTALEVAGLCTTHCVCVQVSDGLTKIYVVSQYLLPSENIEVCLEQLDKVLRSLRKKKRVVGVDANAKSPLWCSRSINERGEALEVIIVQYDLHVLNQSGQAPTFETTRGRSNIDVTMASPQIIPLVKSWRVHGDGTSSDHRILETRLDLGKRTSQPPPPQERRYNTRRADWDRKS